MDARPIHVVCKGSRGYDYRVFSFSCGAEHHVWSQSVNYNREENDPPEDPRLLCMFFITRLAPHSPLTWSAIGKKSVPRISNFASSLCSPTYLPSRMSLWRQESDDDGEASDVQIPTRFSFDVPSVSLRYRGRDSAIALQVYLA